MNSNDEVICLICEKILSQPIVLSCCFSLVCYECIKKSSYQLDNNNSNELYYDCNICKKTQETLQASHISYFITQYIEDLNQKTKNNANSCDRCAEDILTDEVWQCYDCNKRKFCGECDKILHNATLYEHHDRRNLERSKIKNNSERLLNCQNHPSEKIEFICTKDLYMMCTQCIQTHRHICKNHQIMQIKDAQKDILSQLIIKGERLSLARTLAVKENNNIQVNLKELEESFESCKDDIKDLFSQLRDIIDYKEKEIHLQIDYLKSKRKNFLEKEIDNIKQTINNLDGLSKFVSFAVYLNNHISVEGAKLLFGKIEKILNQTPRKETHSVLNINSSPHLYGFEECKNAIYKLTCSSQEQNQERLSHTSKNLTPTHGKSKLETPQKSITSGVNTPNESNQASSKNAQLLDTQNIPTSISFDEYMGESSITTISSKIISDNEFRMKKQNKFTSSEVSNSISPEGIQLNKIINVKARHSNLYSNYKKNYEDITPRNVLPSPRNTLKLQSSYISDKASDKRKAPRTLSGKKNSNGDLSNSSISSFEINHLSDINRDPLLKRHFIKILQTSTSIFVSWTHTFQSNNLVYLLEYGIGSKVGGVEQFRQGYKGASHVCIITDLMPKTSYRLRVCPILIKEEGIETSSSRNSKKHLEKSPQEIYGEWSDITTICTNDPQTLDFATLGSHARFSLKGSEFCLQFDKAGIVTSLFEYSFGKISWDVRLQQQAAHLSSEDTNSLIKIGVTNKVGKSYTILGTPINYGLNKNTIKIKICLDMENRIMVIYNPAHLNGEVFNNLPDGPLYPAFQNKISRNSLNTVKLYIIFDTSYEAPYNVSMPETKFIP